MCIFFSSNFTIKASSHLDGISTDEFLDGGQKARFILLHPAATSGRRWTHFTAFPFALGWVASAAWAGLLRSFTHSQPHYASTSHRKI